MMKKTLLAFFALTLAFLAFKQFDQQSLSAASDTPSTESDSYALATFAGGCFWCMEPPFEKQDGVISAISGYAGGSKADANYKAVSSGRSDHLEVVQIKYDPSKLTYEALLEIFWRQIDPTDAGGSFVDRGKHYTSAIFYHNAEQKEKAEASKEALSKSGLFNKPIATDITKLNAFYPAEDYHQDYYKKSSIRYKLYRNGSGRDQFMKKNWKGHENVDLTPTTSVLKTDETANSPSSSSISTKTSTNTATMKTAIANWKDFVKPSDKELKASLSKIEYKVTQKDGTERAFSGPYVNNKKDGIYVDIVSGEPLFSSTHKYKSGTGWPSFYDIIEKDTIVTKEDRKLWAVRTELRSKYGDSHLGHVFNDGPNPTGLRYCINGAALKFIAKEDMQQLGYGEYLSLFN